MIVVSSRGGRGGMAGAHSGLRVVAVVSESSAILTGDILNESVPELLRKGVGVLPCLKKGVSGVSRRKSDASG